MPILAAEPDFFPSTLFDAPADAGSWMVAQTKPRQEKCLARHLLDEEISFFAPCTPRRNRVRSRIVVARIPLFSSYVFVRGERARILSSGRVVRVLAVADQDRLWTDLRQVWHLTGSGLPLDPVELLEPGVRVRIRTGPMAGLSGSIVRTAGRQRFVVAVDFLGKGVAVELDTHSLAHLPRGRARNEGALA